MLVRYPARLPPRQVAEVVENVDLLPTITELLGVPPLPGLDGISLLPALAGRPASVPPYAVSEFLDAHRALRVDRFKLLAGAGGFRRLFDLKADPGENNDLSDSAPVARRLCEQYLAEALATPAKAARTRDMLAPARRFKAGTVKADPELRRQLEALGYFGGIK
jgi:arylsulfatase A-like enzyme